MPEGPVSTQDENPVLLVRNPTSDPVFLPKGTRLGKGFNCGEEEKILTEALFELDSFENQATES